MTSAWVAYAAVVGLLLALFAVAVEGVARQLRLPSRWGWVASMMVAVALIAIAAFDASRSPTSDATATRPAIAANAVGDATSAGVLSAAREALARAGSAVQAIVAEIARVVPVSVARFLTVLWLFASAAALALLAFVHTRVRLARRTWPAAELHGHHVRVAPTVGPAVVGVIDAEIIVPRWLLQRAEHEQRLVLAHEHEHLHGGDHLTLAAGCLGVALVPWHPALWWMLRRLRLAIELDCDARVLRRGVSASTYGTTLIDLAGQCSGFRVGATALADEGSHLERRILAMKDMPRRRSLIRTGALCVAGSLTLLAACQAKVPTAAEIDAMDVAAAQQNLQRIPGARSDNTVFFVDGKQVDARAAHALTPNQIGSVSVTHGASASEPTTIRIATSGEAAAPATSSGLTRLHNSLHRIVAGPAKPEGIRTPAADPMFSGLVLIDGKVVDGATFAKLNPATIASVEVLKGPRATQLYTDPAAANGVILVVTKGR